MAQNTLPITNFTDAEGSPLANGYLLLALNTDAQTPTGQVSYQRVTRIELNGAGGVANSPAFWPNSEIVPPGTVYVLRAFTAAGQQVAGSLPVTVLPPAAVTGFGISFGTSFSS